MITSGDIVKYENHGGTTKLVVSLDEDIYYKLKRYQEDKGKVIGATLDIDDGRTIRKNQRKMIFAMIRDISIWCGHEPEWLRQLMMYNFCIDTYHEVFSLSNCSVSIAREFTNYLIEFCFKHKVPLNISLRADNEDIDKYLWLCIKYRVCAISGEVGADIHHCTGSRIGMGRNRNKVSNDGLELIALSREWHSKVHTDGEEHIFNKYKVYGITLDKYSQEELGIKKEEIG